MIQLVNSLQVYWPVGVAKSPAFVVTEEMPVVSLSVKPAVGGNFEVPTTLVLEDSTTGEAASWASWSTTGIGIRITVPAEADHAALSTGLAEAFFLPYPPGAVRLLRLRSTRRRCKPWLLSVTLSERR